jgi:hypothetical protein
MRPGSLLAAAACALALSLAPTGADAAAPPDPHDPCSTAGRDSCGTLGVGFYGPSRYGRRWFGDYTNAVPGHPHAFCIDLRYWYASPRYRYRPATSATLVNRDGEVVPATRQAKLAYAIARFGRTSSPGRQAAVMLYVHEQMGDARPGELDAKRPGHGVAAELETIAREAALYHGPYRIETRLGKGLAVGVPTTATIRVLSAQGVPLPDLALSLGTTGADAPARVRTDHAGLAAVSLTPSAVSLSLSVQTARLPSSRPTVFVPTRADAAVNGQRLAVPAYEQPVATVTGRASPDLATAISRPIVRPGSSIFDRIRIHGLGTMPAEVEVELYGPFATRSQLSCAGTPYWHGRVVAYEGETHSPPVRISRAGFYGFREHVLASPVLEGMTTDCAIPVETALVAPRIVAGRGDVARAVAASAPSGRPVAVRIRSLGIAAPVHPVGIDVAHGVLGLPTRIGRAGWWRDGSAPGAAAGTVLIAGHVDSAHAGPGAFFELHRVARGARIDVATSTGGAFAYRVVSVRTLAKNALPTSLYASTGPPRLVLVTCGGPFDRASGHYRDNVVVTAVPLGSGA